MRLTDEQIKKLLDWFVNTSETNKSWSENRKKLMEENHKWIQPDVIKGMSEGELEARFLEYYKTGGGRQKLNMIWKNRIIRDKKRFRETLLFLLDEGKSIEERMQQVLSGKYSIDGFGKAIATSFLMDYNPGKYCLWNNKTEMGFTALGFEKPYEAKDSSGEKYLKVLEKLQWIRDLKPGLSFLSVDLFLHTVSAEDEGIESVRGVAEGIDISQLPAGGTKQVAEIPSMEFAMEKYLEEFIAENFDKIDFGDKLELYQDEQDEEITGRQYHTPIGIIDLLAIDGAKKEFVVIELKKGKGSDVVIGQILKYMGWVKENLAKSGHPVRGIIIAKDKDEKLEYALKLMPNVNLFLYKVAFELIRG